MNGDDTKVIGWGDARDIRWPSVCARCGAPPLEGYTLRGRALTTRVPACAACLQRLRIEVVVYALVSLVVVVLAVGLGAVLIERILSEPSRGAATVIALLLLVGGGALLYLALRRRAAWYHRLRGPVFVIDGEGARFGVRAPAFLEATRRMLAGETVAPTFVPLPLPTYRVPAIVLAIGLVMFAVGIDAYLRLSGVIAVGGQSIRVPWFEALAYELGGPVAVLVLYVVIGLAFSAIGVRWLLRVRRDRAVLGRVADL